MTTRCGLVLFVLAFVVLLLIPAPAQAGYVDGPNRYQYVLSNPIRYVDPTGLWTRACAYIFAILA